MDPAVHARSIARLLAEWCARPGALLLVGHDLPMLLDEAGRPVAHGKQRNAVAGWLGATLDDVTHFPLG